MPVGDNEMGNHLMTKLCTEASVCVVFENGLDLRFDDCPNLWGPRLISRDHRMHVYSDPRDQCSQNTQKLNNKSLTSIHTILHK